MDVFSVLPVVCKTIELNDMNIGSVLSSFVQVDPESKKNYCCNISCTSGGKAVPVIKYRCFNVCEVCFSRITYTLCSKNIGKLPVPFTADDIQKFLDGNTPEPQAETAPETVPQEEEEEAQADQQAEAELQPEPEHERQPEPEPAQQTVKTTPSKRKTNNLQNEEIVEYSTLKKKRIVL